MKITAYVEIKLAARMYIDTASIEGHYSLIIEQFKLCHVYLPFFN